MVTKCNLACFSMTFSDSDRSLSSAENSKTEIYVFEIQKSPVCAALYVTSNVMIPLLFFPYLLSAFICM